MSTENGTATYGNKSLTTIGPNSLPESIKPESSDSRIKEYIDICFGPKCCCTYCKNFTLKA